MAGRINPEFDHDLNRPADLGTVREGADREDLVANEPVQAPSNRRAWNAEFPRHIGRGLSPVVLELRDDPKIKVIDLLRVQWSHPGRWAGGSRVMSEQPQSSTDLSF